MEYAGPFKKMKQHAELARLRAQALREVERKMIRRSYDRVDASRDLLREPVRRLPPS